MSRFRQVSQDCESPFHPQCTSALDFQDRDGQSPLIPRVVFTANLQRHVACPPCEVIGDTLREVLDRAFAGNERARGYVLDEQGAVRKHMVIFINGEMIQDRSTLGDQVADDAEVYVMRALSGG